MRYLVIAAFLLAGCGGTVSLPERSVAPVSPLYVDSPMFEDSPLPEPIVLPTPTPKVRLFLPLVNDD